MKLSKIKDEGAFLPIKQPDTHGHNTGGGPLHVLIERTNTTIKPTFRARCGELLTGGIENNPGEQPCKICFNMKDDEGPMTTAKAIKLKAHAYIMKFNNMGISWKKAQLCAVVLVAELREQYFKNYQGTAAEKDIKAGAFDQLEKAIKAF